MDSGDGVQRNGEAAELMDSTTCDNMGDENSKVAQNQDESSMTSAGMGSEVDIVGAGGDHNSLDNGTEESKVREEVGMGDTEGGVDENNQQSQEKVPEMEPPEANLESAHDETGGTNLPTTNNDEDQQDSAIGSEAKESLSSGPSTMSSEELSTNDDHESQQDGVVQDQDMQTPTDGTVQDVQAPTDDGIANGGIEESDSTGVEEMSSDSKDTESDLSTKKSVAGADDNEFEIEASVEKEENIIVDEEKKQDVSDEKEDENESQQEQLDSVNDDAQDQVTAEDQTHENPVECLSLTDETSSSQMSSTGACAYPEETDEGDDEDEDVDDDEEEEEDSDEEEDSEEEENEDEEEDVQKRFAMQLGILTIKRILEEKGNVNVTLKVLACLFGNRGTREEREAVGMKAVEMLATMKKFDDVFLCQTIPGSGKDWLETEFISLKGGKDEPSLMFVNTVFKLIRILKDKGSLTVKHLSTLLNQTSSVAEKDAVGRNWSTLKETLLALPQVFRVSGETVYVVGGSDSAIGGIAETKPRLEMASIAKEFDASFVYKQLGVLRMKETLQTKGKISLHILCSDFGKAADDEEREAVGRKAADVSETLKEYPGIFDIVAPRHANAQKVTEATKVSLKRGVKDRPSVPYARAMFKLIWILKQTGTLSMPHLSTLLGQSTTLGEREAVGKNPGSLKPNLKPLPKMFKVAGDKVSVATGAHVYAYKRFVLCEEIQAQESIPKVSDEVKKNVISTLTECLRSRGGSCDLNILTKHINACGSANSKQLFGKNGSALLKLLKTMPNLFRCEGSKVYLVNTGQKSKTFSGLAASIPSLGVSNTNVPSSQVLNPIPLQGVLPTSQAKVIPSIEIVFDTKTSGTRGWWTGDINVSQATTTGQQQTTSAAPPLMSTGTQSTQVGGMTTSDRVKQFYMEKNAHSGKQSPAASGGAANQVPSAINSAVAKLAACLDGYKIATIIQIGGFVGSQLSAKERNAVGKNAALLYDTLASMPSKFVIYGPFVGVKHHGALVTGIGKLVTYLESKGRCELNSLLGRLGQSGTVEERSAIGKDLQTFTDTISSLPGVFIIERTTVKLNNGMNGEPCSPTPMNKHTAVTSKHDGNVPWAISTGVTWTSPKLSSDNQNSQTATSMQAAAASNQPVQAPATADPDRPTFSATIVAINNYELCQEFVDTCLAKYEYPIISLAVNKTNNWIALAGWEDHVYLFDMEQAAVKKGSMEDGGFKILADVISSTKILKVVHSCTYVASFLHESYGMKLCNVFDTKVAYQLLCGESTISIHALCKEYGVVNPDKWIAKWSDRTGSVADTVRKPSDDRTGGFARVLIPQIYQHMVMKFSDDSLQEVGKLCEAFLHQQETNTSSASAAAPDSMTTNAAQPASQPVTNGYTNASALTNLPSTGAQSSQSYAMPQPGDLKMSFEATHSKVCNYLKTSGPTPIASLYQLVHRSGAIIADTDLDAFKKSLLRVTSKYILLESGLIDLVEHVESQAVGNVVRILQDRGQIKLELLFREFRKVASGDEIRVAGCTEKAFEMTLMCMGCVEMCEGCVALKAGMDREIEEILAQAMMCSQFKLEQRPDEYDIMSVSQATQVETVAESEPDHRMSWITAEKESNLKAKTDTIGTTEDCNHILMLPNLSRGSEAVIPSQSIKSEGSFCDDSLSGESYTSDLQSLLEENFQEETAAGIARTISGDFCTESENAQKITEYVTRLMEYIGSNGPSTPSQLLAVLHEDEDTKEVVRNTKELSHLLLVQSDNFEFLFADLVGIKPTALTSQNFSKKFRQEYSLTLQQFVEKNGPSTLAQLLSILYNQDQNIDKIVPDTKALSDLLRRYPDKFTFLPSGLIAPVEGRIRAAEKIVDLLQEKEGGCSIMEVYQWFCQHVSTEERMAVFGNSCTVKGYKKKLKQFQHLFLVENDIVILQPSILKDTTTATQAVQAPQCTSSCESTLQADTSETTHECSNSLKKEWVLKLQQYVDQNGPCTLPQLESVLFDEDEAKMAYYKEQVGSLVRTHTDKFTLLPMGLIGPNQMRLKAAEKIVIFLRGKAGYCSFKEINEWFRQHASTEEKHAMYANGSSTATKPLKKNLRRMPHLFAVEGNLVSLQPSELQGATLEPQASQTTNTSEMAMQTETSKTSYNDSYHLRNEYIFRLQQYVDENGPSTLAQLFSVLHQVEDAEIEVNGINELEKLLKSYSDLFKFLPSGQIGPNETKLQAAQMIVNFLQEKGGGCTLNKVNEWFQQHATSDERISVYGHGSKLRLRSLKRLLKRMTHLFIVEDEEVFLYHLALKRTAQVPEMHHISVPTEERHDDEQDCVQSMNIFEKEAEGDRQAQIQPEDVVNNAKDKIVHILRNSDQLNIGQLFWKFRIVASEDEIRSIASTKKAFENNLLLLNCVEMHRDCVTLKAGDESDVQDVLTVTNGNVDLEEDTQYDSMSFSDISDDVHDTKTPDERLSAEHNSDHAEVTKNTKGKEENHGPAQIQSHSPHKSGLDKVHRYLTDHGPTVVLQLFRDIQTITSPEEQRCLGLTAVELMATLQISSQHTFVIWGESIIVDVGRERKELVDETIRFLERIQGQCSLAEMSLWLHQEFPRGIPGMNVTVETLTAMPNLFRVSDTGVSLQLGINSGSRTSHYLGPAGGSIISRYLGRTGTNNSDCDVDYRISSLEKDRKSEEKVQRRKEKAEKKQYKSRLLQYLQQHGPCTLSHLYDNVEAEVEINSIENLRKFMKCQGDTFTFFPSGLVGANEMRMRLAEMIVTFLQQKGSGCSFEEIDDWFCQHASKEERKVFRGHAKLKKKKGFKKAVKSLTHLFVVDGEQVSLCHSSLKRESTLPLADEVIRQTEISKVVHECDNMNASMPCSVNTQHDDISSESDVETRSVFSDCSASDESHTYESEMHSLPMQNCAEEETAGRGMSCEDYDNSHTELQNAQKRTEYVIRLKQYVKRNGPCTLAQLLSVLHEDDEAKAVVCDIKELSDLLLIRSDEFTFVFADLVGLKRKTGTGASLSYPVSGRSHTSDPKLRNLSVQNCAEEIISDTVYPREEEGLSKKRRSKKRGCYGVRLQQYVDKNGPCTLTKLLSILYEEDKDAKRVVSNTKELTKLLKARKDKFTFLPSGLVGPKEVRLSAAHTIVGFLQGKSSSGCNIKEVDEWLRQHGSNEEKNAMIGKKNDQKKLTKNLKRLTHLFVIKGKTQVALRPFVTLKQVSQPTSEHSSERIYASEYHSMTSTGTQQSASEFKLTPTSAKQNHQNMAQLHPSNTKNMFETNRKENSVVQSRQESPLLCDQDEALVSSTVSDLVTAGSTQSSIDMQQATQVTEDPASNAAASDIVKSKKKTKKTALLAASSGHLRETYEKVLTTCGFLKGSYINQVASFVETNGPVSLNELQKELILMLDCEDLAYVSLDEVAQILAIGKGCRTLIQLSSGLITLGPGSKIYNNLGLLREKFIHPLIVYIDENGPTKLSALLSVLQEHIGSEYTITEKEFKRNLMSVHYQIHFRMRFGLVEHNHAKLQAVQKVVDFIGAGNTCSLANIWKWFDENASSRDKNHLGESEKCLCKQLPLLPSVFYVDKDGVTCMQEDESIYNKTGFFQKKLLDPLMVYIDRNGPLSIATFMSLLQEEIGSELTITEEELLRNLQSEQYEIHFSVNETSDLVGPNETKQQAVQKVVEFINSFVRVIKFTESSANAYFFDSVWYWFDRNASSVDKKHLGASKHFFKERLKAMPHIFIVDDECVYLTPEYARADLPDNSISAGSHTSDPKLRSLSVQNGIIHGDYDTVYRREEESVSKKKRQRYGKKLQQYVDKNGPCTLAQLLSILYEEDKDAKRVVSNTKELTKFLKARKDKFTFLPSGLEGPKEVRLSAAHKIVGFLQGKEGSCCSFKEIDEWLCQHSSNQEKKAMIGKKNDQKKLKRNLKNLTHLFVIKGKTKVSLHPSMTLERRSQSASECHSFTWTGTPNTGEFKLTQTSAMQTRQNITQQPSDGESQSETRREESGLVQSRQESPLQCDQDISVSSAVCDLVTAGSTQSSIDLQQVALVNEEQLAGASTLFAATEASPLHQDITNASSGHSDGIFTTSKIPAWSPQQHDAVTTKPRSTCAYNFSYKEGEQSAKASPVSVEIPARILNSCQYGATSKTHDTSNCSFSQVEDDVSVVTHDFSSEGVGNLVKMKSSDISATKSNTQYLPTIAQSFQSSSDSLQSLDGPAAYNQVLSTWSDEADEDKEGCDITHSSAFEVVSPVHNPWGITQQLKDQFAYRNKHDMDKLMAVLGEDITRNLTKLDQSAGMDCGLALLTEVVLDCGRNAQARFYQKASPNSTLDVNISGSPVKQESIQSILDNDWTSPPTPDKRAGIEDTLHRLGIITNRSGRAIGLTASIGRAVLGCVDHIHDLLQDGQSVVMLGRPGVGMTTVLREIARVLSDVKKRRVIIIDTYNQIGGDSDAPHPAIGSARRLQVASRAEQYQTIVEAVQNHTPQTIIIDEIATAPEAQTVKKLVQRGVQVITTAHSCNFVDFYQNTEFRHVTGMGEDGGEISGSKKTKPAFQVLIELCDRDRWIVHKDFGSSIDAYLQGMRPVVEERQRTWDYNKGSFTNQQCIVKLVEAPLSSNSL